MARRIPTLFWPKGVRYDLYDKFDTVVAAGSVNGTTGGPKGLVRTVTDTNSKLDITDGVLNFATGGAAAGNPGLWYPAQTLAAGKMFLGKYQYTSNGINHGWDDATSGVPRNSLRFNTISAQACIEASAITVGTAVTGTEYNLCVIQRTTGNFYYIKGGAFTYWTLVYCHPTGNTSVYPSVTALGSTSVFTADNLRIPAQKWLPVPLVSDGFSADTADGLGHLEANGGGGLTWTGATWGVSGGKLLNTPTLGNELATGNLVVGQWYSITATQANYFYTGCAVGDTWRATATTALDANNKVKQITLATMFRTVPVSTKDVVAEVVVSAYSLKSQAGMIISLDDATTPANFLLCYLKGDGNGTIVQCLAGTYSVLGVASTATFGAAYVMRFLRRGTTAYFVYNNVLISVADVTINVGITGLRVGLFSTLATNSFDNFAVWPSGLGNEYSILDKF